MNKNLYYQAFSVNRQLRNNLNQHRSLVLWFTGLSGSGKSTLANLLQERLANRRIHTYILDGDNVRLGLNGDLDFSEQGRKENIRRVAEVAKLMVDAGLVVITGFISPFKEDREIARKIIGKDDFFEIYIDASLETCEERDVKGLYSKARKGEIPHFTGISSPYEAPEYPFITVKSGENDIETCLKQIEDSINAKLSL